MLLNRRTLGAVLMVVALAPAAWAQPPAGDAPAPCGPALCPTPEVAAPAGDPVGDRPGRVWLEAEALLWWMRGADLPPLVTTSPPGTPLTRAGVLGSPGTEVLFGGNQVN